MNAPLKDITMRQSGFDPADNICWQFCNPGDRDITRGREHRRTCPACSVNFDKRTLAYFGRCRSGQRWFWSAHTFGTGRCANGFVATDAEAMDAAMLAIRDFREGLPILAQVSHGCASHALKELNKAKRAARPPPDTTDSRVVDYLFSGKRSDYGYGNLNLHRFRITKRTAKRIFYARECESVDEHGEPITSMGRDVSGRGKVGFVDRVKLETDGSIWTSHTWWPDWHLYLSLEALIADLRRHDEKPIDPTDLAALKQAMADAHPDHGGSTAAFIAARARYVAARRSQRAGATVTAAE